MEADAGHVTKNLYRYLDIFDIGGSQSAQSTNLKENIGSYTGYFTGMNHFRSDFQQFQAKATENRQYQCWNKRFHYEVLSLKGRQLFRHSIQRMKTMKFL